MQRIDFLIKENKKDIKNGFLETINLKHETIQVKPEAPSVQENQQLAVPNNLEFFTGFAWCQSLLFKSWIEASDRLEKIRAERVDDATEISSLYVDVHEEVFTNLFKSQLYASSLGRMINASMLIMKNWQNLACGSDPGNAGYPNQNK